MLSVRGQRVGERGEAERKGVRFAYIPYHADHEVGDILGVDGASRFVLLERAWVRDVIFRGVG